MNTCHFCGAEAHLTYTRGRANWWVCGPCRQKKEDEQCEYKMVYHPIGRSGSFNRCERLWKHDVDGTKYCSTHEPSRIQAKKDAAHIRWEAESETRMRPYHLSDLASDYYRAATSYTNVEDLMEKLEELNRKYEDIMGTHPRAKAERTQETKGEQL